MDNVTHTHKIVRHDAPRIMAFKNDVPIGRFESIRQICRRLPIDRRSVQRVLHGNRSHHKGYRFEFIND